MFWPSLKADFFAIWPNREAELKQEAIEKAELEEEQARNPPKKRKKSKNVADADASPTVFKDHNAWCAKREYVSRVSLYSETVLIANISASDALVLQSHGSIASREGSRHHQSP